MGTFRQCAAWCCNPATTAMFAAVSAPARGPPPATIPSCPLGAASNTSGPRNSERCSATRVWTSSPQRAGDRSGSGSPPQLRTRVPPPAEAAVGGDYRLYLRKNGCTVFTKRKRRSSVSARERRTQNPIPINRDKTTTRFIGRSTRTHRRDGRESSAGCQKMDLRTQLGHSKLEKSHKRREGSSSIRVFGRPLKCSSRGHQEARSR